MYINPIALRKAKIVYNFDLSECNRVIRVIQMLIMTCFVLLFFFICMFQGNTPPAQKQAFFFAFATIDKRPVYM